LYSLASFVVAEIAVCTTEVSEKALEDRLSGRRQWWAFFFPLEFRKRSMLLTPEFRNPSASYSARRISEGLATETVR
jgi:hypothetical protein